MRWASTVHISGDRDEEAEGKPGRPEPVEMDEKELGPLRHWITG